MAWLRRAGRGTLPDGATVLWSVAEGGRGRRWRWTVADADRVRHVGLMELAADGRFARLELDAADALVTFHPDGATASAHGNIVRPSGVVPISMDWSDGTGISIDGDPFGSALWPGTTVVVIIGTSGATKSAAAPAPALERDERGVPVLADAQEWALEE